MGKHKEENESLIKYGLDTDVWFHVDNLSSAHVYLRMPEGWKWDSIPEEVLIDCAQLCKANSIHGNKKDNITVIYTPWSNLHKSGAMVDGQVGFKRDKEVKKVFINTRLNAIINRLTKTKEELYPDLKADKEAYEKELERTQKERQRQYQKEQLEWARERKRLAQQRDHAYDDLFTDENMRHAANDNRNSDGEEDFM